MGLFLFILIVLLVFLYSPLVSSRPRYKKPTKLELINNYLPKSIITTENPEPDFYCINIPIRIYNLYKDPSNGRARVHFDLLYFSLFKGEFSTGESVISYDLNELYTIFQKAVQTKESTISVNWTPRKLTVFTEDTYKIHNFNVLKNLYKEQKNVEQDLEKLNREIAKVESLLSAIETSNLYQYQAGIYQRGLGLLKQSQAKANGIRDEYLKILREYTLSFYLEDIESTVFQAESNEIAWETKYRLFREDYDLLQSMIAEYKKLSSGSSLE